MFLSIKQVKRLPGSNLLFQFGRTDVQRPDLNGLLTTFSEIKSLFDQSGFEIKTLVPTSCFARVSKTELVFLLTPGPLTHLLG